MGTTDNISKTSAVTLVTTSITPKSAAYSVSGSGNVAYVITIPHETFNITNTEGTGTMATMAVTSMTCSKGNVVDGSVASFFDDDGNDTFTVGGTLTVASAQAKGLYTGTFDVTVAY